jgi:hypothetical protein
LIAESRVVDERVRGIAAVARRAVEIDGHLRIAARAFGDVRAGLGAAAVLTVRPAVERSDDAQPTRRRRRHDDNDEPEATNSHPAKRISRAEVKLGLGILDIE